MKIKKLVTLLGLAITLTFTKVNAGELVAFIVGDVRGNGIEEGVKRDMRNIQAELQEISHYTGLNLREVVVTEERVKRGEIISELDKLSVDSDDVVMFFYSGHGSHEGKNPSNPWPYMMLSQDRTTLDFDEVTYRLQQKNPRLLLSFANACNSLAPPLDSPDQLEIASEVDYSWLLSHDSKMENNYKKLFVESKGAVVATSSKVGEASFGRPSYGGYYPFVLVTSMQDEVKTAETPSWDSILQKAAAQVMPKQTPDYFTQVE